MTVIGGDESEPSSWTRRRTYGLLAGLLYAPAVLAALLPVSVTTSGGTAKCGTAVRAAMTTTDGEICTEAGRDRVTTSLRFLLLAVPFGVAYVAASDRERD